MWYIIYLIIYLICDATIILDHSAVLLAVRNKKIKNKPKGEKKYLMNE